MLHLTRILGAASEPDMARRLHALEHEGKLEWLVLSRNDTLRRRLRVRTDRGTECAIALSRSERLHNGAVLLLEPERAIVVRMKEPPWLGLEPEDRADALELGYFAGNAHWRVRFRGPVIEIALDGPAEDYLDRLRPFLQSGRARRVGDAE